MVESLGDEVFRDVVARATKLDGERAPMRQQMNGLTSAGLFFQRVVSEMTKNAWLDVCLTILVFSAVGCAAKQEQRTTTDSTVSNQTDGEHLRYQGEAEARLARLGARIDSLHGAISRQEAKAKVELQQEVDDLEERKREATRRLEALKAAGAGQWDQAKRHVGDVLDSLDRRFDSLRSRLRDDRG
jgi:hypothetical protein